MIMTEEKEFMEQSPFGIERIDYVERLYLPADEQSEKTKYSIFPDGKVISDTYESGSRKRAYRLTKTIPVEDVFDFYCRIHECARNIIGQDIIIDDCSGTLTIHYMYGHTETLDRGSYSETASVDSIFGDLFQKAFPDKYMDE